MWSGRSPGPTPSQFLLRREGICDRLAPGSFLSFLAPCGPICITRLNLRYGSPLRTDAEITRYVDLLGGHPYLVHRGLHEMAARALEIAAFEAQADRDEGIFGDHLRR